MNADAPAREGTARYWRKAWFAVWSPPVAWVGSIAVLMFCGLLPWWCSGLAGLGIVLCGLMGISVVVEGALDSLQATLGPRVASGREKARLACLSLFGVLVSMVSYGCLVLFGGFVAMVSPLRDFKLG